MHFFVTEKFCDFFTVRPSDLNTTLTYALWITFVLVLYTLMMTIPMLIK